MAAAASIIIQQLYSELSKVERTLANTALLQNLLVRQKEIEAALAAYTLKPSKATAKTLSTTLLCNFGTVVVSYTDQSGGGVKTKSVTNNSMDGSPGDPSTHGEQRAWREIQNWYKTLIKPTIIGIAIASDRAPCVESANACSVYFGPGGNATKLSAANPLVFTPAKNPFIYALKDFSNSVLLAELLKTDFNFYAMVTRTLLNDKSNNRYYSKVFAEIQKIDPELYARWSLELKRAADVPAGPAMPAGVSPAGVTAAAGFAAAARPVGVDEAKNAAGASATAAAASPSPGSMQDRFSLVANQMGALKLNPPADPKYPPYKLNGVLITSLPPRPPRPPRAPRHPVADPDSGDKPRGPGK